MSLPLSCTLLPAGRLPPREPSVPANPPPPPSPHSPEAGNGGLRLSKNPPGFSDKRLAVCCAHNLSVCDGQIPHWQPERYFISRTCRGLVPPSGGAGGEKPRTGTGGEDAGRKFPARPVRTPGRAHGLFEAHSGLTPWPWPQCCRIFPVPLLAIVYGEQAATPPPLKQRGGRASGGHTWPPNIKCGWCWPGAGVPGQRRRAASGGGAKPRAALLPRCKHGPRGGGPAGRSSSLSPYTVAAVTFGEEKAQTGLRTGTTPPLVLRRGRTHIPRRPAPCRPLPWRVGGAAPPR